MRVSSYIDDEVYVHETQVHMRMMRAKLEEERRKRDEDEELKNNLIPIYGSFEGHIEPEADYKHVEGDAYQASRFEQIENDVGIEIYIIVKVRQFRQMMEEDLSDENILTGYAIFREFQRMMMIIIGAETRKEVIDYIRSLRQYTYHVKKGHEDVNCPLEENEWPDGWMAANWGSPRILREFRMPQRRERRRSNGSKTFEEQDAAAAAAGSRSK